MKHITLWIFWVATAAALIGCSSLKVSEDYDTAVDFSTLKTFAWKDVNQPETGDIRVDSPLIDQRIRMAIKTHLALKGLEYSEVDLPDVNVAYTYTIISKLQSGSVAPGVGVGIGVGSGATMGGIGVHTGVDVSQYDQGLLVVDILSRATEKLLWRGTSTRVVHTHSNPEKITEDIDATIEKLLAQFPPEQPAK